LKELAAAFLGVKEDRSRELFFLFSKKGKQTEHNHQALRTMATRIEEDFISLAHVSDGLSTKNAKRSQNGKRSLRDRKQNNKRRKGDHTTVTLDKLESLEQQTHQSKKQQTETQTPAKLQSGDESDDSNHGATTIDNQEETSAINEQPQRNQQSKQKLQEQQRKQRLDEREKQLLTLVFGGNTSNGSVPSSVVQQPKNEHAFGSQQEDFYSNDEQSSGVDEDIVSPTKEGHSGPAWEDEDDTNGTVRVPVDATNLRISRRTKTISTKEYQQQLQKRYVFVTSNTVFLICSCFLLF
jgi:hypothetical protein